MTIKIGRYFVNMEGDEIEVDIDYHDKPEDNTYPYIYLTKEELEGMLEFLERQQVKEAGC